MLYFAYGSNLLRERLRSRCPSAEKISNARFLDHRVVFNKKSGDGSSKANVLRVDGEKAFGVLWEIPDREFAALQKSEGPGYEMTIVTVIDKRGDSRDAVTFKATSKLRTDLLPYDCYVALILSGARQNDLDSSVARALLEQPCKIGPDDPRKRECVAQIARAGFDAVCGLPDASTAPSGS